MENDAKGLPWFRVKLVDGREVEIHSPNAIQIYEENLAGLILHPQKVQGPPMQERKAGGEARSEGGDSVEVPTIRTAKSTTDNLKALFDTEWAKSGRFASELTKALEVNAVPDSSKNIHKYLKRLVHSNEIRRITKNGVYRYFPIPR